MYFKFYHVLTSLLPVSLVFPMLQVKTSSKGGRGRRGGGKGREKGGGRGRRGNKLSRKLFTYLPLDKLFLSAGS